MSANVTIDTAPLATQATAAQRHGSISRLTKLYLVSLTATNYVGQYAAGAPINDTNPAHLTVFAPTRVPEIVLGAGGGTVSFTISGTSIVDGSAITEVIAFTGPATKVSTKAFAAITSFTSTVDPGGTVDLKALDTMVYPPARALIVGTTAGAVAMQLAEDSAVQTVPGIQLGDHAYAVQRINISGTAAAGLTLGY